MKLDHIINGVDVTEKCKDIEIRLAMLAKPRVFWGKKSVEITYDKQFEEMCLILSHNIQVQPHSMTVLQFYNAFEYMKKISSKNKAK